MIGKRVLIPLKGCFLNSEGTRESGFRNMIVTGILQSINEDGSLTLGDEDGNVLTIVPKESAGAILTEGSSFYQGPGDGEELSFDVDDSSVN